jgi:hypothetical protein
LYSIATARDCLNLWSNFVVTHHWRNLYCSVRQAPQNGVWCFTFRCTHWNSESCLKASRINIHILYKCCLPCLWVLSSGTEELLWISIHWSISWVEVSLELTGLHLKVPKSHATCDTERLQRIRWARKAPFLVAS